MSGDAEAGWNIFVMEDDGLIAMHIADILEELGHVVVGPERTIERALAALASVPVDMAILDVNLGNGETSYPVAEVLTRLGIRFAFITGYGESGVRGDFSDRPVISKPIDESRLAMTLRMLRSNSES